MTGFVVQVFVASTAQTRLCS